MTERSLEELRGEVHEKPAADTRHQEELRAAGLLHEQFDDIAQQEEAATLGMWVFLGTEMMMFGALFLAYTVYRITYPHAFAEASHHLYKSIGTVNTSILLTSSLTMALSVLAASEGRRRGNLGLLALTLLLGSTFLALKWTEYYLDWTDEHIFPVASFDPTKFVDPWHAQLFFVFYWVLTGLHVVHLSAGLVLLSVLLVLAWRGRFTPEQHDPLKIGGMYWSFVDVVWIFLYPLLYLVK